MAVSGACLFSQGAPCGCEWCLFVQSGSCLWLSVVPVCSVRELLVAVCGACLFSQGAPVCQGAPCGCVQWCLFVQSGSSLWL